MKRTCRAERLIDAAPEAIWAVVADVTRVGEWSGECRGCDWVTPWNHAEAGARFRGRNHRSWLFWTRLNEIVEADEPRRLVWRTVASFPYPDSVEWRLDLEPAEGGTRVCESFNVLNIPRLMEWLIWLALPAHRNRTVDIENDLDRLKAVVEGS